MFAAALLFIFVGLILVALTLALKLAAVLFWLGLAILILGGIGYVVGKGFRKGNS